jgi:ubiquinone/menaquinone biosynthesis C-methylase UbiE
MTIPPLSDDVQQYYNRGREQSRLQGNTGLLEFVRTQEIILRYLAEPPLRIVDVGGGAGIHALWLAQRGYEVHLIDAMPLHVEQARQAAAQQPDHPLASTEVGDARALDFADGSADVVLLLGPMYHLTERADRMQALREAYRVLRPGGVIFVATISRFASLFDGIMRGFISDSYFNDLVDQDLRDGQHRNPSGLFGYFATAFFHHPDEIHTEVGEAEYSVEAQITVEGLGMALSNIDGLFQDEALRERILGFLRTIESEPALRGATGHMITMGRKPIRG